MQNTSQKIIVPVSIIIAGALIAAAIFFTQSQPKDRPSVSDALNKANNPTAINVPPVSDADHIRGNKNAKLVIVDYSDLECPFCKTFHETVARIQKEYGSDIAWVYRHFPLDIHEKAPKEAEASECANEVGGSEGFWKFIDEVYKVTPSNDGLDLAQLPVIAERVGIDKAAFTACLDSGKYAKKIDDDYTSARAAGASGTPYTVLLVDGEAIPLVDEQGRGLGALPYASLKAIIDQFMK